MSRNKPSKITVETYTQNGRTTYRVRFYEQGKRVTKTFQTKSEADSFASVLQKTHSMPLQTQVSAKSILITMQIVELCERLELSQDEVLDDAYKYVVAKYTDTFGKSNMPISELIGKFMALKSRTNCRPATIREYNIHFSMVEKILDKDRKITTLIKEDMQKILNSRSTESMREHCLIKMNALFNYAVKEGFLKESPTKNVSLEKVKGDEKPPSVFTIDEVVKIFKKVMPPDSKDKFRHTFASYGYHYMPIHLIIEIMRHIRNYNKFCKNYKGIARPADAQAYFAITPETLKNT